MTESRMNLSTLISCALLALIASACQPSPPAYSPKASPSEPVAALKMDGAQVAGGAEDKARGAVKKAAAKPSFRYSPFVLKVNAKESVFKTVSFKDVGVRDVNDPDRALLYETLAESLAYGLTSDSQLAMTSSVHYDEAILDPSNHLACGSDHLYVDIWRSKNRWGYSLWSGCGEADNFAWKEVDYSPDPSGDVMTDIDPLTRDILSTLRASHARGCYQKAC